MNNNPGGRTASATRPRFTASDMDASAHSPRFACNGWHQWTAGHCERCGIPDPSPELSGRMVFTIPGDLTHDQREAIRARLQTTLAALVADARRHAHAEGVAR